jgi:hypothetical protein
MLRALGAYLHGRDLPGLGIWPPAMKPVGRLLNRLPRPLRETVYRLGGWWEAIPADRLGDVRAEVLARWVVDQYPRRRYPAAAIGSSNGAATHLWAALGIPWLPQTFLIPVRARVDPDQPRQSLEWRPRWLTARGQSRLSPPSHARHMHDANQDRLMIRYMQYFRVKRSRLGEAFTQFLEETLGPGATLFVVECGLSWPTTRIAERHVFQHGALGGATPDEYLKGSARVEPICAVTMCRGDAGIRHSRTARHPRPNGASSRPSSTTSSGWRGGTAGASVASSSSNRKT